MAYERKVAEIFGYPSTTQYDQIIEIWNKYPCPFINSKCDKPSQHRDYDSKIPFGACSVWHKADTSDKPEPVIICPSRFFDELKVFHEACLLFNRNSSDLKIIVLDEFELPIIGRVDYIIGLYDTKTKTVVDFLLLELMACSTTFTGDVLCSLHDILQGKTTTKKLKYGINFRQVLSRMMVQVMAKAYACELWNKKMVWVIQDVLYDYMIKTTKLSLTIISPDKLESLDPRINILFYVYCLHFNPNMNKFELLLKGIYGGNKESIRGIFEPTTIPSKDTMMAMINKRLLEKGSKLEFT
jgi:hypothetical protein